MPKLKSVFLTLLLTATLASGAEAQEIHNDRGADPRVDYQELDRIGPWDDRNYELTREDLAWLAPNEEQIRDATPAFFRVYLRKTLPSLGAGTTVRYPSSALPMFFAMYGGYLVEGRHYAEAEHVAGRYRIPLEPPAPAALPDLAWRAFSGNTRVTTPGTSAESAIKINPIDSNTVIAGSNRLPQGQQMYYSTNGGAAWTEAAPLPSNGGICCDPAVEWSADGTRAYAATLGGTGTGSCQTILFYRSGDQGRSWGDLPGDPGDNFLPRRSISTSCIADREALHVDKSLLSPFRERIYATWHDLNVLKFSQSSNFGASFSDPVALSTGSAEKGFGGDITTDRGGNVYYFWPAFESRRILVRKSTNGGLSFGPTVQVAGTNASFKFRLPAADSRGAFVYVSADTDQSSGPFANRLYVAWTDSTTLSSENDPPAQSHGRIQVAFSANGGSSWTVRTPHETLDASTVDRFHPFLAVGPDGTVHVIFYDTRLNSARTSLDVFHSRSTDGGNTWSAPARLSTQTSPPVSNSFDVGDYNGLDVVGTQLLASFTDNRKEAGEPLDSLDIYSAAPASAPVGTTLTFTSIAAHDGWVLEASETSNTGGTLMATATGAAALRVGDAISDQQYKAIVSFDTSPIPDTATILSATLRLRRGTVVGTSPFSTHGECRVDVKTRGFNEAVQLELEDFSAPATAVNVARLSSAANDGDFSTANLDAAGLAAINKTARTQLRIYFALDDNDDLGVDYIGYMSGENAPGSQPELVVTYQ